MILSRALGKRRIAEGQRPGWLAAWGPVAADAAMLGVLFAICLPLVWPLVLTWPVWGRIALLFIVVFVPVQVVLITSALWAARSRWNNEDPPEPNR